MFNDIASMFTRLFNGKDEIVVPVISSVGNGMRGEKGDTGEQGPQGPKGDPGEGSAVNVERMAREVEAAALRTAENAEVAQQEAANAMFYVSMIDNMIEYISQTSHEFNENETYFIRTGEGTPTDPYKYMHVDNPVAADIDTYYKLEVSQYALKYIANYIYTISNIQLKIEQDSISFTDTRDNVAGHIAVNDSGYPVFYLDRCDIVDMQQGNWKWFIEYNGDLCLKMIG